MDLWSISLKSCNRGVFCAKNCPFPPRNSWSERSFICSLGKFEFLGGENGGILEIKSQKLKGPSHGLLIVRAKSKKNDDNPSSSGNDQSIPKGGDPEETLSHKLQHSVTDWRTFRANLVSREQIQLLDTDASLENPGANYLKPLSAKWAHPIPIPETGCVLVATEKLDGVRTFERTVVLLLRSGTKDPREGPFGVVINRPLYKNIKDMKSSNHDLATTFADCSLHFGGPLDASMFLLNTNEKSQLLGFEQVIPGLSFGARNSLDEAASLVKRGVLRPQDFRFFVGYAGWQLDQLREEIESDYWYVVACSANVINCSSPDSSSGLWEEILQLMGGSYSELSRKPKQDSS